MNKRIIVGIGSAATVLVVGAAAVLSGVALTQRSEIEYMTDGPTYADITDDGMVRHPSFKRLVT